VEQNNRFIKCIQGGTQQNLLCNERILKEFLVEGNAKYAHLTGGNDLFTQKFEYGVTRKCTV
jgi:hypothetical protein